jgi:hypothetical protein
MFGSIQSLPVCHESQTNLLQYPEGIDEVYAVT